MNCLFTLLQLRDTLFEEAVAATSATPMKSERAGLNRAHAMVSDLIQIELDEREKQARAFGE